MLKFIFLLVLVSCSAWGAKIPKGLAPRLDGRIVGGVPTTIQNYPHQISLRYFGYHRCGGSIYSTTIIITAAHCTSDIGASNFQIVAGETFQSKGDGIRRQVKSKAEHEGFDPWQYLNDVAILWLEEGLDFGQYVQPIALASTGEKLKGGTMVHVTGWGTLLPGGATPDQLQIVYVSVVGNKECADAYADINPVTDSMMCAGEPYGGKDACQGDSGGPLITNNKLYGIVSWGVSCAMAEFPGVYADVGNLRDWIDFKIALN